MKQSRWPIDPFIGGTIIVTILLLIGVVFVGSNAASTKEDVTASTQVELSVESNSHDWGTIDYDGGIVSKTFEIKNSGNTTLKLYDVKTSCMCTTAQLKTPESTSEKYGMHEKSGDVFSVQPGETAELLVEFDPAFHGPSGVGLVTRTVTMNTNDAKNSTLTFNLKGSVVKK